MPVPIPARPAPTKKRAVMPVQTSSLEDQPDRLNALYYGNEGTGKTSHLAAAAHEGRVLIVAAEAGLKRRALLRLGIPVENIHVWPPDNGEITFDRMEELFWDLHSDLVDDPDYWHTVGWDSGTEVTIKLTEDARDAAIEAQAKAHMDKNRFFTDRDDYGMMTGQMRLLLRRFAKDLPCNFVVTCLERRDQDDDGTVKYGPAVTPALQNDMLGIMDVVGHCTVVETEGVTEFIAEFKPVDKYRSKERLAGAVPARLINPTFPRLLAYASEQLDTESDPDYQEALVRRRSVRERKEAEKVEKATKKAPASKKAAARAVSVPDGDGAGSDDS